MVNKQADQVEFISDAVNDVRSNIIQMMSNLYKTICDRGNSQEYTYENFRLTFKYGKMNMEGCIDIIQVTGDRYSDVRLGEKISSYGHIPMEWILSFKQ